MNIFQKFLAYIQGKTHNVSNILSKLEDTFHQRESAAAHHEQEAVAHIKAIAEAEANKVKAEGEAVRARVVAASNIYSLINGQTPGKV